MNLLLTTSDLIGHMRSKVTFLSITVSLLSLQLNKGDSTSGLFKEGQQSYLTSWRRGVAHIYILAPQKTGSQLHRDDSRTLPRAVFSCRRQAEVLRAQHKGQVPPQKALSGFVRCIQEGSCGSAGTKAAQCVLLPPDTSTMGC